MLHHKFSLLDDSLAFEQHDLIRISHSLIQKMTPDLSKYRFTWNGRTKPRFGLCRDGTLIQPDEVGFLKSCLLRQPQTEPEYAKFMGLIDRALAENRGIAHQDGSPGCLAHHFILCNELPQTFHFPLYKDRCIKILDQFILENYNVFKNVPLYWNNLQKTGPGFCYYGITIITPSMAQSLLDAMAQFLANDTSELAEYFPGEEYDILRGLLTSSIANHQFLIHFGI